MSDGLELRQSPGVNVIGYVHEQSGLGEIARLVVTSARSAGIPVEVVPVGRRPLTSRAVRVKAPYDTTIICVNADALPRFVERFGQAFFRDRRTIGFWWWEVESFPTRLSAAAHLVDEIWVGSSHVASAVAQVVDRPVAVFPVPIVKPLPQPVSRASLGLPEDRFVFLFAFNFSSVFDRKNPLGLIDAFTRAFRPDEGPLLVLKSVNSKPFPEEFARLRDATTGRPDVLLLDGPLDAARYHALVAAADSYVSLHRAEGLGLTIAEAMSLGKPAVATAYSGNLEFMTPDNSYLVPYAPIPIPPGTGPYPPDATWADPDLDRAADILREIVASPEEARLRSERGSALPEEYTVGRAAAFIRGRLADIATEHVVPVADIDRALYELMWGPDLEHARPLPRLARKLMHPLLRPYLDHQRNVLSLILDSMRHNRSR